MAMPATGAPSRGPQQRDDPRRTRSALVGDLGAAAARRQWRRRRRQRWAMGLMAVLTVAALGVIAGFVVIISRTAVPPQPAALTAKAHTLSPSASAPPSQAPAGQSPARASASASAPAPALAAPKGPQVTDASSGLSYPLLAQPWQRGCPAVLATPVFSWTAGEHATAGPASIGGSVITWHGNACSGLLGQAFSYSGPADLGPVATGVADATDPAYYAGLNHTRLTDESSSIQVSGHPAWIVTFTVSYPDAAQEQLAWTSETGAVVLVDRGAGQPPAVFYASVPSNLGPGAVTALVGSLRLG
jgi:hypothetical protein